ITRWTARAFRIGLLLDVFSQEREDGRDAHPRRVDDDRVGGRLHGRDGSACIPGVALADVAEDRLEADALAMAPGPIIGKAAAGPLLVGGRKVVLPKGGGGHHSTLVACLR